jgi:hypothetical protein
MVPALLANPQGTICGTLGQDAAAMKAAYRLFDCKQVTHQSVLAPHRRIVEAALALPGMYLLIEDTTSITPASGAVTGGQRRGGSPSTQATACSAAASNVLLAISPS